MPSGSPSAIAMEPRPLLRHRRISIKRWANGLSSSRFGPTKCTASLGRTSWWLGIQKYPYHQRPFNCSGKRSSPCSLRTYTRPKITSKLPAPKAARPMRDLYDREYLDTLDALSRRNLPPASEMCQMPLPLSSETSPKVTKPSSRLMNAPQTTTNTSPGASVASPRVLDALPVTQVTDAVSLEATDQGIRGVKLAAIILALCLIAFLVTMIRQLPSFHQGVTTKADSDRDKPSLRSLYHVSLRP